MDTLRWDDATSPKLVPAFLSGYLTNDSIASGLGPHTAAPATASCSFAPPFQVLMELVLLGHTLLHQADPGVLSCHCNVVPEILE